MSPLLRGPTGFLSRKYISKNYDHHLEALLPRKCVPVNTQNSGAPVREKTKRLKRIMWVMVQADSGILGC
jgi:hypothetical protein